MNSIDKINSLEKVFNLRWDNDKRLEMSDQFYKYLVDLNETRRKETECKYGFLYLKMRPDLSNEILKKSFSDTISHFNGL
jgi:hypothetical protein